MLAEIVESFKERLETLFNAEDVIIGYYPETVQPDLRKPNILIDPMEYDDEQDTTARNKGEYLLRLWIIVDIQEAGSWMHSLRQIEKILSAEDAAKTIRGVDAVIADLKRDDIFSNLKGSAGGREWNIGGKVIEKGKTKLNVSLLASNRVNVAQVPITIYYKIAK